MANLSPKTGAVARLVHQETSFRQRQTMHAAIVDSSRVVQKMVAQHFVDRGDTASTFDNSVEALNSINNDASIDILITSLEVSPLSGLELCWQSRLAANMRRPLYIAVMTSANDTDHIAQALDCGADDLIAKPICRQQLYARLRVVARLHNAQNRLVQLAETDTLTGVLNRGALFEKLNAWLADPEKTQSLSAIMLDIDHFKRINDTYGHQLGDDVIRATAAEAAKIGGGVVGRLGGEEFVLILPGPTEEQAVSMADDLRQRCAELVFNTENDPFQMTCSCGVSRRVEGDTADTLLRRADIALYKAKTGGRNQVKFAGRHEMRMPGMESSIIRHEKAR